MKYMGLAFILFSCISASIQILREERKRVEMPKNLCSSLENMQAELASRACPLPDLFTALARSAEGEAEVFFTGICGSMNMLGRESFSEIWDMCAEESFTLLNREEMRLLKRIGAVLGRYELDEQLKILRQCTNSFNENLKCAEYKYLSEKKLKLALGAGTGLMLIIVLI